MATKRLFYTQCALSLIAIFLVELQSEGPKYGPDALPIHLSYCFLFFNLIALFLFNFKATQNLGKVLSWVSVAIILFLALEIIQHA